MPRWIDDILGYNQILADDDTPVRRRHNLKFVGATVVDNGEATVVTTSGATTQAEYFLGAPEPALPNHRLPVESSTIGWNLATPNTFVAFVKPGSVLSALQFREQDVDVAQRDKLNVINTASINLDFTDDGIAEEVELRATRAALSGAITAAAGDNVTAFGAAASLSVLANATNGSAVPDYLQAAAAREHLRVNAAGTALEWGVLQLADFPVIASDTFLANVGIAPAAPVAVALTSVAGPGLVWDSTLNEFQVGGSTSIIVGANDVQRAALTGFVSAAQNVNATTSAEPIVSYSASANMTNERVLTSGINTVVDISVASQIRVNVDDFPLTGLADQAANTIVANATAGLAPPTAVAVAADSLLARVGGNLVSHPWNTVAGDGLTYSAGVIAVGGSTSIIVGTNDVQRAALTGDVTALQNSNATTIANNAVTNPKMADMPAISVKSNPTASIGDPQDVVASAVRQVYHVNTGGTALEWGEPNQLYNSSLALQGDWYQFRALNGTHTTSAATVTTRGANVSWSVDLSTLVPAIDSVSVVANGTVLERAALTGAIAAAQNSGATVFSGIRLNGATVADQTNLNLINGTRTTASVVQDVPNDELEVTYNWTGVGLYQSDLSTFVKNALDIAPIDGDSIQGIATNPGGNGGGLQYNYTGTTSEITLASATGNLGTINIAALKCGGSYRVSSASSSFSIEGFTAKQVGFWFQFFFDELAGGDECTLFHEDATATATNRLSIPGRKDLTNKGIRGIFIYGGNSRWNFVSPDPAYIGTANNYMRADDGRAAEIATSSTDVNITAGGTASVNISAGNDVNITASAGVGSNGDVFVSADNLIMAGCVPRSDFGTLGGAALATWGPVFVLSRDVTAGTPGAAGDSTFFNADAPFAFRVLLCGCDITTGSGAGDTVTFRNATGGGGLPVCGAMPTAVAGQSIGNSITPLSGTGTIPAGGTLVARWTDRAAVGTVWALCVRTS